jgi:hypothetical protein
MQPGFIQSSEKFSASFDHRGGEFPPSRWSAHGGSLFVVVYQSFFSDVTTPYSRAVHAVR